jgi:hypothetical protein
VHWLVAWTKPLLVFYNHNASVVRLSLNLYREFDFDRATHLTNLVKFFFLENISFLLNLFLVGTRKSLSLCFFTRRYWNDNESIKVRGAFFCCLIMKFNIFSNYFNQCFRPFHPKMCQDWVMTVMQVN